MRLGVSDASIERSDEPALCGPCRRRPRQYSKPGSQQLVMEEGHVPRGTALALGQKRRMSVDDA